VRVSKTSDSNSRKLTLFEIFQLLTRLFYLKFSDSTLLSKILKGFFEKSFPLPIDSIQALQIDIDLQLPLSKHNLSTLITIPAHHIILIA